MTAKERLLLFLYQTPTGATVGQGRELVLEVISETVERCAEVADAHQYHGGLVLNVSCGKMIAVEIRKVRP